MAFSVIVGLLAGALTLIFYVIYKWVKLYVFQRYWTCMNSLTNTCTCIRWSVSMLHAERGDHETLKSGDRARSWRLASLILVHRCGKLMVWWSLVPWQEAKHAKILTSSPFFFQVCLHPIPVPEAVWNQRTSTNSIPGTLQGQSQNGKIMTYD